MPAISATLINSNPSEVSEEVFSSAVLDVFDLCIENSPVDTGAFQEAWELNQITNDIYEIVNPLEYASFLEDGWSDQAPDGILEPAIRELSSIIQDYLGFLPKGQLTVSIEVPDYVPG